MSWKLMPGGSVPITKIVGGVAKPDVVIVKVPGVPSVKVVWLGLVMTPDCGVGFTSALTNTVWLVAPALLTPTVPAKAPSPAAAAAVMRASMVVLGTLPPVGVSVNVE